LEQLGRTPADFFFFQSLELASVGSKAALALVVFSLGAPMVLKVVDAKKEKDKNILSSLVLRGTAYYRFE
jgi:hypothetical protein